MQNCLLLAVLLCSAIGSKAWAKGDFKPSAATTIPESSRFEVVQSNLAPKWTFLLDRHEGRVYQLVVTKYGNNAWEGMLVVGSPVPYKKATYQIFASGLSARFTFLVDTESGNTWTLSSQKGKTATYFVWAPFSSSVVEAKRAFDQYRPNLVQDLLDGIKISKPIQDDSAATTPSPTPNLE